MREFTLTVTVKSDDKRSMAHMLNEVAKQIYEEDFIDDDEQCAAFSGNLNYEDGDTASWFTITTYTR